MFKALLDLVRGRNLDSWRPGCVQAWRKLRRNPQLQQPFCSRLCCPEDAHAPITPMQADNSACAPSRLADGKAVSQSPQQMALRTAGLQKDGAGQGASARKLGATDFGSVGKAVMGALSHEGFHYVGLAEVVVPGTEEQPAAATTPTRRLQQGRAPSRQLRGHKGPLREVTVLWPQGHMYVKPIEVRLWHAIQGSPGPGPSCKHAWHLLPPQNRSMQPLHDPMTQADASATPRALPSYIPPGGLPVHGAAESAAAAAAGLGGDRRSALIIGADSRTQVTSNTFPWSTMGQYVYTHHDGGG